MLNVCAYIFTVFVFIIGKKEKCNYACKCFLLFCFVLLLLFFVAFFSLLLFEWFTLYIYMCVCVCVFRLTLKYFLYIIVVLILVCPASLSLSLSPSLSLSLSAIVIWTVRIVAGSSHLLCVWFRPTLTFTRLLVRNFY